MYLFSFQVITWFQNRRAKLKRDVEDLKSHRSPEEIVEIKKENFPESSSNSPKILIENSKKSQKRPNTSDIIEVAAKKSRLNS